MGPCGQKCGAGADTLLELLQFSQGCLAQPSAQSHHRAFVQEIRGGRENGSAGGLKGAEANAVDP